MNEKETEMELRAKMYLEKDHVIRPEVGTREWDEYKSWRDISGKNKYTMPDGRNAQEIRSPIADILEELYDARAIIRVATTAGRFEKAKANAICDKIYTSIVEIIGYIKELVDAGKLDGLLKDLPYPKETKGAENND